MEINADFGKRAAMHGARLPWVPSPMPGVERRMLDRVGGEVARATSIVRYAPGSLFSSHVHGGGEEFLVLDGVFSDEHGDYPAGWYIRNPPTSQHTPGSAPGCTIFVKLWQFDPEDRKGIRVDTDALSFMPSAERAGVDAKQLWEDERELVRLERWTAGSRIELNSSAGLEVLVTSGWFTDGDEVFERHSWLRLPEGAKLTAQTGPSGCKVWIKTRLP